MAIVLVVMAGCAKKKDEVGNYYLFGKSGSPADKQCTVKVVGIDSFTCTFDAITRTIDLTENNRDYQTEEEINQDPATPIPDYSIK
jgi:hypothetical protein